MVARWEPSKSSVICSKNFIPDEFVCNYTDTNDQELIGATIEYSATVREVLLSVAACKVYNLMSQRLGGSPVAVRV